MEPLKDLVIDGKTYKIIYFIDYNNREYVILNNIDDEYDVKCLRVTEEEIFGLEKLDSEDELLEVMKIFYEENKGELEN